jgi:hypothetical protein
VAIPPTANASFTETALIAAVVDAYVDWREESTAVRHSYERWTDAAGEDRRGAFAAYVAALDREACAGDRYASVIAVYRRRPRERRRRTRA